MRGVAVAGVLGTHREGCDKRRGTEVDGAERRGGGLRRIGYGIGWDKEGWLMGRAIRVGRRGSQRTRGSSALETI